METVKYIRDSYLTKLYEKHCVPLPDISVSVLIPPMVPAQTDGYNCGVFVLAFSKAILCKKDFDFKCEHMLQFRQIIKQELRSGKVSTKIKHQDENSVGEVTKVQAVIRDIIKKELLNEDEDTTNQNYLGQEQKVETAIGNENVLRLPYFDVDNVACEIEIDSTDDLVDLSPYAEELLNSINNEQTMFVRDDVNNSDYHGQDEIRNEQGTKRKIASEQPVSNKKLKMVKQGNFENAIQLIENEEKTRLEDFVRQVILDLLEDVIAKQDEQSVQGDDHQQHRDEECSEEVPAKQASQSHAQGKKDEVEEKQEHSDVGEEADQLCENEKPYREEVRAKQAVQEEQGDEEQQNRDEECSEEVTAKQASQSHAPAMKDEVEEKQEPSDVGEEADQLCENEKPSREDVPAKQAEQKHRDEVVPPSKEADLKIVSQILICYPKSRGWTNLKHDQKSRLIDKMKQFVTMKGHNGKFKGNPSSILNCLTECKKVVSDFKINVSNIKFNRSIGTQEEKMVFQKILANASIKKKFNEDKGNFEYIFADLNIQQFQCFVKLFA